MLLALSGLYSAAILLAGTPAPTYGTFFGGTGDYNPAVAVAVDPSGNVIVAGYTTSQTLPGTANAFQPLKATGFPDNADVFVAKFDPTGQTLLWSTFLGGDGNDVPAAIAVDPTGNIYVVGTTQSSNFPGSHSISCVPISGTNFLIAFQQNCSTQPAANAAGGFISKLSPDGRTLLYSVGFGTSSGPWRPSALAVDGQGEAYVGTQGVAGMFLFRLNAAGTGLVYGAFIGTGDIAAISVDSQGNCYAVGLATGTLPITTNALQRANSNANLNPDLANGFILEVNPNGSKLVYGTWFGPQYSWTSITGIAVNSDGSVYFAGATNATTLQATPGAYLSTPSGGFVAKFTFGSMTLDALSYLPFPSPQYCGNILQAGNCGSVYLTTSSQTQTAYILFYANEGGGIGGTLELKLPALGAASPTPSITFPLEAFIPSSVALEPPSTVWVVGECAVYQSCALGNLISRNAFQSVPPGPGQNAVLIQLTDISPTISFLGSAATGSSPFAAGQLISIYGMQLGPTPGSTTQENPAGVVTNSNGGTQVLFDGVAAPILYTGASQINTAIPCSVAGKASTQMVVQYLGASSFPFTVPLSIAAPGIFTLNGSGSGEAVVLNQDYSLNGPANPAARGSAVSFYATRIGPTSPCVDGQTYQTNFPLATLQVIAGVGNLGAQVLYAGQAPYFMAGVDQINIVIPSGSPTGSVPLSLLVNGVFSPPGVTIAVK